MAMTVTEQILKIVGNDLFDLEYLDHATKVMGLEVNERPIRRIIKSLAEIIEKQSEALEFYADRNGLEDWPVDAQDAIADTQARLKELGIE